MSKVCIPRKRRGTSTLFRTLPEVLLGILLCLCITALTAEAQTPVEFLFELDGNAIDQTAIGDPDDGLPPDDWGWGDDTGSWDYVAGPSVNVSGDPGGFAHLSSFVSDPNGDTGIDDIFTGGGSKDDLPIKAGVDNANGWAWTYGTPPDKDDLLGVGAAAYIPVIGELLIYDFGSLYAANGTSSIGNWFFKKDIGPCLGGPHDGTFGIVDGNDPDRPCLDEQPEGPLHSIGDILIISENSNGGTVTNISVYKWVAGEYDECEGKDPNWSFVPPKNNLCLVGEFAGATCDGNLATNPYACGIMNQESSEAPDSYLFESKFPPDVADPYPVGTNGIDAFDYPAYSFLEAGLNISEILEDTECFSSFMKNTRTSAKPRSQLKDFAGGAFELCGIEVKKYCDAELNDAGNQVDVDFYGDLTNTGVVDLEIVLADSEAGSNITKVCYDTNGETGVCDSSDEVPSDLNLDGEGAAFTLDAGRAVLYEGLYAFNGQLTSLKFEDTIMAIASLGENVVDTAEDKAECYIDPRPGIAVTKNCSPSYVNGDTFIADIYGGAENTGNVTLVDVGLSDTVFSASELTVVFDSNGNGIVDSGEPPFVMGVDDLVAKGKLAYKATFTSTSVTAHANTMTANGYNFFDTSDEWKAVASTECGVNPKPELGIKKVCDPSMGSGSPTNGTGVQLKKHDSLPIVMVEVGNIITVTNTGDEDMNVAVSDSEADLVAPTGWTTSDDSCATHDPDDFNCITGLLQAGKPDPGDGSNEIVIQRSYDPDGDHIFDVLSNPGSVKFKNTATATGKGVLSGKSPPKVEATAECKICPDCPDCPQP